MYRYQIISAIVVCVTVAMLAGLWGYLLGWRHGTRFMLRSTKTLTTNGDRS